MSNDKKTPDSLDSSGGRKGRTKSFSVGKKDHWIFVVDKDGQESLLEATDFDVVEPLGFGRQGKVYSAKVIFENEEGDLETKQCVLKTVPRRRRDPVPFSAHEKISQADQSSIENNIIKLIKVIHHDDGEYYALLPFCNMFLDSVIMALKKMSKEDPGQFDKIKNLLALHLLSDLCDAYISMHLDKNYVHGDVKPANVGFYCGHWCLIDMDCAKKMGDEVTQYSGTPAFTHPSAVCDRDNLSLPWSDLFALGEMVNLIFSPENYGLYSDREILEKKDSLYRHALRKKYQGAPQRKSSLTVLLSSAGSVEEKLMYIASALTEPLATDQVDLLELTSCVKTLKRNARFEPQVFDALETFYASLKTSGYLKADSELPLVDVFTHSVSDSLFTPDSVSFFSERRTDHGFLDSLSRHSISGSIGNISSNIDSLLTTQGNSPVDKKNGR